MIETHDPDALTIGPIVRLEGVRVPGPRGATLAAWWLFSLPLLDRLGPCGPACWTFKALMMIGPPLVFVWWLLRGSARRSVAWRLDEEGVGRRSSDGETRFLRWEDVEAVRMLEDSITLRGGGVDVTVPLRIAGTDRKAVAEFVAARLPAGFDLHSSPRAFGPIGPFLKRVVLAVACTLLFLATIFVPISVQECGGPRIGWIGFASLYVWIRIAVVALYRHAPEIEKSMWIRPSGRESVDGAS